MILTCPKCSTRYLAKDAAIPSNGRTVRCAKCETTWFVSEEQGQQAAQAYAKRQKQASKGAGKAVDPDALALIDNQQDPIVELGTGDKPLIDTPPKSQNPSEPPNAAKQPAAPASLGAHISLRDKADAEKLSRRRRVIFWIWAIPMGMLAFAAILGFIYRQEIVNRIPLTASVYKSFGVIVKQAGLDIEPPIAKTAIIEGETVLVVNSAVKNLSGKTQNLPLVQLTLENGSGEALVQWHVELEQVKLGAKGRLEFASQFPNPPVDTVKLSYRFAQ